MICATIVTVGLVINNKYSEESYVVDTSNSSVDCSINTADVKLESQFYWASDDAVLAKYLKRYNIVVDMNHLDDMNVTQEWIEESQIP